MSEKLFTQLLLGITLSFSIAIFFAAINILTPSDVELWAVLVAILAVISSIVSAWSSYRVIDLQKQALQPSIDIDYDFEGRYGLAQIKLTNNGGSTAFKIHVQWNNHLHNHKGEPIHFGTEKNNYTVSHLTPNSSINKIINSDFKFFEIYKNTDISGKIVFEDSNGKQLINYFSISAEHFRGSPTYSNEELRTHTEIQKIPNSINKISSEIRKLNERLQNLD